MNYKKSDSNKHYDWLMSADMYLASAIILLNELSISYPSPMKCFGNDQRIGQLCGFTSCNPDYEILMPIIFNLKHGVELFLKALKMVLNIEDDYLPGHDSIDLLNDLIRELEFQKKDKAIIEVLNKDVRKIIEKYYYGIYAFSENKSKSDKNNEAERYPEYKNCNCYEISDKDLITPDLISSIKKDIVNLQRFFREDVLIKIWN